MPGQKVRADFDQLNDIAVRWGKQRDAVQTVKTNLQTRVNTLRNGDWVGDSAEVFYVEMESVVFPALGRGWWRRWMTPRRPRWIFVR